MPVAFLPVNSTSPDARNRCMLTRPRGKTRLQPKRAELLTCIGNESPSSQHRLGPSPVNITLKQLTRPNNVTQWVPACARTADKYNLHDRELLLTYKSVTPDLVRGPIFAATQQVTKLGYRPSPVRQGLIEVPPPGRAAADQSVVLLTASSPRCCGGVIKFAQSRSLGAIAASWAVPPPFHYRVRHARYFSLLQ